MRIETGQSSRRGLSGIERDEEFAISGKQKDSVREETNAVSGDEHVKSAPKKKLHPLSTNTKRKKCVEKKEPQRPEPVWEVQSTAVQRLLEKYGH